METHRKWNGLILAIALILVGNQQAIIDALNQFLPAEASYTAIVITLVTIGFAFLREYTKPEKTDTPSQDTVAEPEVAEEGV